ncbi:MAG TPA: hypothetical protein VLE91_04085 [Candidatus Saccharimonadales bacterium]|nr:hypothetical protein [Candidatus Saccharimonadales bacterium]
MPSGRVAERNADKGESSDSEQEATKKKAAEKKAVGTAKEKPQKKSTFQKELDKQEKKLKEQGPEKASFAEVRRGLEISAAIQDEKHPKGSINSAELKRLLITKGHFSEKVVEKMELAEMIVAFQMVVKHTDIAEPTVADVGVDEKSASYKPTKKELEMMVAQVKGEGEETLTVDKVREYVEEPKKGEVPDLSKVEGILASLQAAGLMQDVTITPEMVSADEARKIEIERINAHANDGKTEVIYETEIGSEPVRLYSGREGELSLSEMSDAKYNAKNLTKIIEDAGLARDAALPKDFDEWSLKQRQDYVAQNFDVKPTGAKFEGVMPPPPTPGAIDFETRLDQHIRAYGGDYSGDRLSRAWSLTDQIGGALRRGEITDTEYASLMTRMADEVQNTNQEVRKEAQQDHQYRQMQAELDNNFGTVYKLAKRLLENGDHDALRLLERAREMSIEIHDLPPGFDIERKATWQNKIEHFQFYDAEGNLIANENYDYYQFVFEVTRAVQQVAGSRGKEAVRGILGAGLTRDHVTPTRTIAGVDKDYLLSRFVSNDPSKTLIREMDNFYEYLRKNLSPSERNALIGDIEREGPLATSSIRSGLIPFQNRMGQLAMMVFLSNETRLDRSGLRLWAGLRAIEGVSDGIKYSEVAQAPGNWRDTELNMDRFLGTIELTGLSGQDAQQYIGLAYQMLTLVPLDNPEGAGIYAKVKRKIEAFKFKQFMTITWHQSSGDPEKMAHIFGAEMEGVKEETFSDVVDRFWRDPQGRSYFVKHDAGTPDERVEWINIHDTAHRLYSERYRDEMGVVKNIVQELTRYSIMDHIDDPLDPDTMNAITTAIDFRNLPAEWKQSIPNTPEGNAEWDRRYGRRLMGTTTVEKGLDPAVWRNMTKWELELQMARQWIFNKWNAMAVDTHFKHKHPTWFDAAGNLTQTWAEGGMRGSMTKAIVQAWYRETTVHGAFGDVEQKGEADEVKTGDVDDLLDSLYRTGVISNDPEELREWRDSIVNNKLTYFDVRRKEMRKIFRDKLAEMDLKVDTGKHQWDNNAAVPGIMTAADRMREHRMPDESADIDAEALQELDDSGALSSAELNAFDLSYIFQHAAYNVIRIYGKASLTREYRERRSDDAEALVINASSNMYNSFIVDHNWEYFHPDFEHRGRGLGVDESNELMRAGFPGRYHWIFPHISMAVRFGSHFLTPQDKEKVRIRRDELIRDNVPFLPEDPEKRGDFEDLMEGYAKRELFDSGAISFAGEKFSTVAEEKEAMTKYALIDNNDDRLRHLKWVKKFQHFLNTLDPRLFQELTDKSKDAPSTRNARTWLWTSFMMEGYYKASRKRQQYFSDPDVTSTQWEGFIENAVSRGDMLPEQGQEFIKRKLGMGPGLLGKSFFRTMRALWEDEKRENQIKRKGWILRILALFGTMAIAGFGQGSKGLGEQLKNTK